MPDKQQFKTTVEGWEARLTPEQAAVLRDGLTTVVLPGPLRPAW